MNILLLRAEPGIALQVVYRLNGAGVRPHLAGASKAEHLSRSRYVASYTPLDLPAIDAANLESFRQTVERIAGATGADMLPGDEHTNPSVGAATLSAPSSAQQTWCVH